MQEVLGFFAITLLAASEPEHADESPDLHGDLISAARRRTEVRKAAKASFVKRFSVFAST